MFKERIKKAVSSMIYFVLMIISVVGFLFSLNWLSVAFPVQFGIATDIGMYIVSGIFLLFFLIAVIAIVVKLTHWLIIEPYQEYKDKKIKN